MKILQIRSDSMDQSPLSKAQGHRDVTLGSEYYWKTKLLYIDKSNDNAWDYRGRAKLSNLAMSGRGIVLM